MTVGRIDAIGADDKRAGNVSYTSQTKKKNPWDEIGAAMNGFGSMMNLPDISNGMSLFTVGKQGGTQEAGAFKA